MSRTKYPRLHEASVHTRAWIADRALDGGVPAPSKHYIDTVVRMRAAWGAKGIKFTEPAESAYWGYYMSEGKSWRVEVRLKYGERIRGYITLTTGWSPAFMLLQKTNSRGSWITLGPDDEIVRAWWRQ